MSSRTLRMGGWLLVIAAVLSLVTTVLGIVIPGPAGPNGPPTNVVSIINIIAGILFLIGLPVAYLVQRRQVGIVGLIGIIALWLTALLFDIVLSIISMAFVPSSQAAAGSPPAFLFTLFIIGTALELIGGILFGLKTIQAHVFPAAIGWLLIVAAVLNAIDFPLQGTISTIVSTVSSVLLFVALGWLGYEVTTHAAEAVIEPEVRRASQ
jgi:hypothetical protein